MAADAEARPSAHGRGGAWRRADGRVRTGWRLALFMGAALSVQQIAQPLLPATLPWSTIPTLLGCVLAGTALLRLEGRPVGELGFALDRRAPLGAIGGLFLGILLGAAAVGLIAACGGVRWRADAGDFGGWVGVGAASLWLFALPAAAEEAMIRGYFLVVLPEAWGAGGALVATSLVFALLHLPNPSVSPLGLLNIAAAGLFLGALRLRTGSLWWATGAHLGWNWTLAFLSDLPVSGLELVNAPLIEPVIRGPGWMSGGSFGPEGSALATGVVLLFARAAWGWRAPRPRGDVIVLAAASDAAQPGGGS